MARRRGRTAGPAAGSWKGGGGTPYGTRTRVSAVKGRRPRPLDEGAKISTRAVGIRHNTVNQEQNVLFLCQFYFKL